MKRCGVIFIAAATMLVAPWCTGDLLWAQAADAPAAITLMVHVRNGSSGSPAAEGTPVQLVAVAADDKPHFLDGITEPGGIARIQVPPELAAAGPLRCSAVADHRGHRFFSEPFRLSPGRPMAMTLVTVYDPLPPIGLPAWSYAALALIFALALALVAFRHSDRQLAE